MLYSINTDDVALCLCSFSFMVVAVTQSPQMETTAMLPSNTFKSVTLLLATGFFFAATLKNKPQSPVVCWIDVIEFKSLRQNLNKLPHPVPIEIVLMGWKDDCNRKSFYKALGLLVNSFIKLFSICKFRLTETQASAASLQASLQTVLSGRCVEDFLNDLMKLYFSLIKINEHLI